MLITTVFVFFIFIAIMWKSKNEVRYSGRGKLTEKLGQFFYKKINGRFSPDVMAAMLVYSQQRMLIITCSEHQNGRYVYCLLCLLGLCENQEFDII